MVRLIVTAALSLWLSACAGYTLGGAKPAALAGVKSIAIPQFTNQSLEPRLSVLVTNSVVDAFAQDGTYAIKTPSSSDATLVATLTDVSYKQYRSNRFDTLASDELTVELNISWKLIQGQRVLISGQASGSTNFETGDNLSISRQNAFPLAASRAAEEIVISLTEGF